MKIILPLSLLFLFSCSASYEKLSKESFNPPTSLSKHLMEAYKNVSQLSSTVNILNVNDIMEIKKYYNENFNITVYTPSYVLYPRMLNVRHLPDIVKENLIEKYKNQDDCPFVTELYKDRSEYIFQKGLSYIKRLAEFRKMNVSKLWPEYFS